MFKQKTAYGLLRGLVGSGRCIRDTVRAAVFRNFLLVGMIFYCWLLVVVREIDNG